MNEPNTTIPETTNTAPPRVEAVVAAVRSYLDATGATVAKGDCIVAGTRPGGLLIEIGPVDAIASQTLAGTEMIRHATKGHRPLLVDDSQIGGRHYAWCLECDAAPASGNEG